MRNYKKNCCMIFDNNEHNIYLTTYNIESGAVDLLNWKLGKKPNCDRF